MKCCKRLIGIALLGFSMSSHAGFFSNTAHSRANCAGFNESVTWNGMVNHDWRVESHHFISISDPRPLHIINTGRNYTWRAAAYHWNEAYSSRGDNWYVMGYHFFYENGRQILDVITGAMDCSAYDGWWDQ